MGGLYCSSKTKNEIRRLIVQNAVTFNGKKVNTIDAIIKIADENQLKIGKRLFFKVIKS